VALNAGVTWGIARLLNPRLLSLTRFGVLELGNSFDRLRACGPSAGRFDGLKTPSLSRGSGPAALRRAVSTGSRPPVCLGAQGLRPFGGPFRRAQDPEFVSGLRACGPSTGSGPAAAAEAHLSAGGLGPCDGELKNSCFVAVRAHLTNWACGGYKIRKCLQVANRTTHPRANPPRSGGRPGRSSKGLSKAGRRPRQCGAKLLRPSGRVFPCTSSFP